MKVYYTTIQSIYYFVCDLVYIYLFGDRHNIILNLIMYIINIYDNNVFVQKRVFPDGTSKIMYPDGSQETKYPDGRIRKKDKDGNLTLDTRVSLQNIILEIRFIQKLLVLH